jgi:hypothetical protein
MQQVAYSSGSRLHWCQADNGTHAWCSDHHNGTGAHTQLELNLVMLKYFRYTNRKCWRAYHVHFVVSCKQCKASWNNMVMSPVREILYPIILTVGCLNCWWLSPIQQFLVSSPVGTEDTQTQTQTQTHTHTHTHKHKHTYTQTNTRTHKRTHARTRKRIYVIAYRN